MIAEPFTAGLRHERMVVWAGLAALIAASWAYLLLGAGIEMDKMDMGGGMIMLMTPAWTAGYAALVLLMWAVMMTAMMLPGAAPAIVQAVGLAREQPGKSGVAAALSFTVGYLMVWAAFSVAATLLQWALDFAGLLSETMASASPVAAGLLVIAVGLYQLAPLQQACLRRCRSCADDHRENATPGAGGMMARGLRYGVACLGCCGVLMVLLFVGGVMNVYWMAAITIGVLAEKLLPWGSAVARVAGAGLIAWGSILLAFAVL